MTSPKTSKALSTRTLLVAAAIGVATGLISAFAGWLSVPLAASAPVLYGLLLGAHVLPGIVGQDILRVPGAAILTHVLAALVATAFSPQWAGRYIGAALLIGGLQEGIAALGKYKSWSIGRYILGSAVIGVILAVGIGVAGAANKFDTGGKILYIACFVIGPILWTLVGVGISRAVRRAGIQ